MANFIQMAIGGDAALKQTFENLSRRQIKSISRRAVVVGGEVVQRHAKKLAPVDKRRKTGEHMRDTIITKVKTYAKSGKTASIIGPASYRAPHKHLVEFGSKAVKRPAVKGDPLAFRWAKLGGRMVRVRHTGKMPAFHFMERASEKSRAEVRQVMASTFRDSLKRAANKEARAVSKIAGKFKGAKFSKSELKAIGNLG